MLVKPRTSHPPDRENVFWGFVWEAPRLPLKTPQRHYEMFFVRSADQFAAAVLYMGPEELHWYVDPKYRKQRLLVEPLKTVILPLIFARWKAPTQRASSESTREYHAASVKLAERVGFVEVERDDTKLIFKISREKVNDWTPFKFQKRPLDDLRSLEDEVRLATRKIRLLLDAAQVGYLSLPDPRRIREIGYSIDDAENFVCDLLDALSYPAPPCPATLSRLSLMDKDLEIVARI